METLNVGVLGGTFDPIHNGHVFVADFVKEKLGLERIYLVTAKAPPHKSHHIAAAEIRHAMVEAAVKDKPHLVPSRIELDRPGTSYTVDTFRQLQAELGAAVRLHLITSAEYLVPDSPTWLKNWDGAAEIFKLCRIVVTPRRHMDATMCESWKTLLPDADIIVVDLPSPPISSLMVKRQLKRQLPVDDLVPHAVAEMIEQQKIYCSDTMIDPAVSSEQQVETPIIQAQSPVTTAK